MKYEVGMRVRATMDGPKGDVGTVIKTEELTVLVRFDNWSEGHGDDKNEWWLCYDEIEPVSVAEAAGTFKVGDRVRCVANEMDKGEGLTGTVVEVGEKPIFVRVDFGGSFDGHGSSGHCWNFFSPWQQLQHAASQQLTIREGGYYRTRDGRKVGPMEVWGPDLFNVSDDIDGRLWHSNGERYSRNNSHDDLIAEWTDEPANDNRHDTASTAGFTVPVFDDEDEPKRASIGDFTVSLNTDDAINKLDAIIAKLRQIDDMASELGISFAA